MTKQSKSIGILCAILSAVCYGTNPFGALPLYEEGVNTALIVGILFILFAVMLVVVGKDLHMRTLTHVVNRLWHWR